jgi:hypothetical protein
MCEKLISAGGIVNSNRVIRNIANGKVFVGLCVAAFCLVGSFAAQAQTYTPNDIYTIAGGGAVPSTPLNLDLPGPTAAIKDTAGNIYIAAPATAYVFKLNTKGKLSVFAGQGHGGYSGDGKQAINALIAGVTGLAIDGSGNIYLADAAGSRIRKVATGGIISTVAGNGVKCDQARTCGDGGTATSAQLNLPESVAVNSAGTLIYIADMTDNRIRVVNNTGSSITIAGVTIGNGDIQTVAGNSTACSNAGGTPPTCGDGGPANQANLTMPYGVAVDSLGNIYIADTRDQEIRIVAAGQTDIATFAGDGLPCTNQSSGCGDGGAPASARLWLPRGVFTDAAGDVYIADTNSNRIRYVAKGSNVITTSVDSTGGQGFAGDTGAATAALTDGPVGIFADSSGNLLVSDTGNQRIRQVTIGTTPAINTIVGGSMGGDGGPPTAAMLADPWDVAEDAAGNLYIVDQANNRIRKVTNPVGTNPVISTVAGTGSAGYTGDGGLATLATLNSPSGIAIGTNGIIYILDENNFVVRAVNTTASTITLGTVSILPGDIATVFGNSFGSCVPTALCGDGGPPLGAVFQGPLFITLDSANNVYVSDYEGGRVREWYVSGNIVSTVAGIGIQNYSGNGGLATLAEIDHPAGIVVESNGNIVIDDQWADTVQYVVPGGDINTYALTTSPHFSGDGGPCTAGTMFNPLALAIDPANDVFISGGNNDVVQRCSAATGIFSTVAGNPSNASVAGFSGDGGPAIAARLANLGTYVDGSNNLYIADGGNNRVRYVPLAPAVTFSANSMSLGQWPLGKVGTAVPLTVTGAGGMDVSTPVFTFTGTNAADFSQTNNCKTAVSPQAICTVQVALTPSQYGEETATLNVADNVTGSPQLINLTGYGPDFAVSVSPSSVTVPPGSTGTSTVSLTPQARFNLAVTLSCASGLPFGASCSFSPNPTQLYGASVSTSTLTIYTSSTTPAGTYTVTITGTYGTLSNSATVTLIVP